MASNRARAGKRKGSDPELTQLLKLVLAKLGDGDSDSGDAASEVEDNGVGLTRPRQTHVAPRAAFPPVKRRNKRQVAVAQQPLSSRSAILLPEQAPVHVTAPTTESTYDVPHSGWDDAVPASTLGVETLLADIQRSLSNLSAHSAGPAVQPSPQTWVVEPSTFSSSERAQATPPPQVNAQDPTAQALMAVYQLLTNINTSATPPPTTPWSNYLLQKSVLELKRQGEALAAAHSVPPLQVTLWARVSLWHQVL
ncbi:hypothetical protein NDU88_007556 [Pleurodeles waltl]|uniref:Uncharacterized protein n=1 Tax=Pleurodeles waltl TaxID=8319 RepID=A0AAV7VUT2_PLEWA|nr:hypothetical protein NDU88_007556 [Pleurodeles waltl]